MKRCVLLGLAFLFLGGAAAGAESGLGLGIILGEPTGLSLKSWMRGMKAIDAGLAWSFDDRDMLQAHADLLFHNFRTFKVREGRLGWYYGVGGRLKSLRDEVRIGLRLPVGLTYLFDRPSIDLFFEVVPLLDLIPGTRTDVQGGLGFRYYF